MPKIRATERRRALAADAAANAWNEKYPVGTAVSVRKDNGVVLETHTRSEAWTLGASCHGPGHTAVVKVNGISGGYDLERVTPRAEAAAS